MNSVATVKPATDGIVATVGAQYANGIISAAYFKDEQSDLEQRPGDEALQGHHREVRRRRAGSRRPGVLRGREGGVVRQALYKAGKNLTRQRLMNAVLSMNQPNKFLLPNIKR